MRMIHSVVIREKPPSKRPRKQSRDVEGPFDHIRTCICSPLKITFSVGTSQYKVAICPLVNPDKILMLLFKRIHTFDTF